MKEAKDRREGNDARDLLESRKSGESQNWNTLCNSSPNAQGASPTPPACLNSNSPEWPPANGAYCSNASGRCLASANVTHVMIGGNGGAVHIQQGAEYGSFTQQYASPNVQVTQPGSYPSSPVGVPRPLSVNSVDLCPENADTIAQLCRSLEVLSTSDPNWQSHKCNVRERNAAVFNNELMADVHFLVGTNGSVKRIPAHKYVLATGSSVFYAMFFGGLAETQDEITVPDVDPAAFLAMLKYLYTDEIELNPDVVLATLYAAKKYILPFLARACVNYLEMSLTAKNACLLLSQSRLFEEPELMQRCWEVVDAQAEMALQSDGFADIDYATLQSVLSRNTLNCREVVVFEAAISWATAACLRQKEKPTAEKLREALGEALFLIRIPAMTLEEFANGAAQSGILTLQEINDIFLHFTAVNKPVVRFACDPRTGLQAQVCHRFMSCAYRSNQWRYRGRCDSIQFSVDRRIFIVGFGLYGSSNGAADYAVKMELKRAGQVIAEANTTLSSDGSSKTFHVYFPHPIQVEADMYYTASAILDGGELSYFGQEGMTEVAVGSNPTITFQFQCSADSTNGTGVQGGQIPELIFYGPSPPPEA